jgi:transcriptional regulator with XRE-family HTH domain
VTGNDRTPVPSGGGRSVFGMDTQGAVREFLASRRARITPEQAGLPNFGGTRRVAGLRRAEVAMIAGVSPDYYTRLERGNLSGVSDSVLDAIARALHLDDAERSHLHDLARAANTSPRVRRRPAKQQQIRPGVQSLLDAMTDAPAFVRNDFRTRWAAHNVRLHHTGVKRFQHPVVGRLDLAFEAMPLPADPGLTLTAYSATAGNPTGDALRMLASWAATTMPADVPTEQV